MSEPLHPLKIVCFGDSLTLGYQSPTPRSPFVENRPYGNYVQEWLGTRGRVVIHGVCGETTQDMRLRFQKDVLYPGPHVAIILGGTNDLGWGITPDAIMDNLTFFYEQAQAQGILPVAVTVPSLRDDSGQDDESETSQSGQGVTAVVERAIALRVMLNQSIKELGHEQQFPVVDWFTDTCESQTQSLAPEFSNDGLHLNTAGYLKLAELVWNQVLEDLLNTQK
ncbi:MAG: GDSL-type esterase/lipase family protein [Nitrospirota bacterium]|nr:GDSL-type esterase/lipase family protein [Nitrospirota bacterium]